MGLADRFFFSSESFDASATMANISYASTAPTVGQANSPVSLILITFYIDLHFSPQYHVSPSLFYSTLYRYLLSWL